jgi:hypothetical protein
MNRAVRSARSMVLFSVFAMVVFLQRDGYDGAARGSLEA